MNIHEPSVLWLHITYFEVNFSLQNTHCRWVLKRCSVTTFAYHPMKDPCYMRNNANMFKLM
jgi:hypothetical protein